MNQKRFEIPKSKQKQNVFFGYLVGMIVCVALAAFITSWFVKTFDLKTYEMYIFIGLALVLLISVYLLFRNEAHPSAFEITPNACIVTYNDGKKTHLSYKDMTIIFQIAFNQVKRSVAGQYLKFLDSSGIQKVYFSLDMYFDDDKIHSLINELARYTVVRIEDGRTGTATEVGKENDL